MAAPSSAREDAPTNAYRPPIIHTPRNRTGLGSHWAMSPGARTIPAAMVLPTAAETPNQTPSTLRRRPREGTPRFAPLAVGAADRGKDKSDSSGKESSQDKYGTSRNGAMIMGEEENASEDWGGVRDWRRESIPTRACAREAATERRERHRSRAHVSREPLNGKA